MNNWLEYVAIRTWGSWGLKLSELKSFAFFFDKIVLLGVHAVHRRMGVHRLLGLQGVPLVRVLRIRYLYIYILIYFRLFPSFRDHLPSWGSGEGGLASLAVASWLRWWVEGWGVGAVESRSAGLLKFSQLPEFPPPPREIIIKINELHRLRLFRALRAVIGWISYFLGIFECYIPFLGVRWESYRSRSILLELFK